VVQGRDDVTRTRVEFVRMRALMVGPGDLEVWGVSTEVGSPGGGRVRRRPGAPSQAAWRTAWSVQ
jgi:hypothetical protein